ncbi:MAG: glycosyltransferase family 4 protein [Firmicutes bacterium]|nr:glycosyltransferase family 4 protein [Bacillota bacterium]
MGKSRLIFFDTTNYTDFPIGGQLTSVRSLLRFLCETCPERCGGIVLYGVSKKQEEVGRLRKLPLFGQNITFLPAAAAETDLAHTAKSLRAAFAKGILRYGRQLHITKEDCCYLQTPEAYGPVKLLCPGASIVIFSHGSYANMERGFRFFQDDSVKSRLIRGAFLGYLKSVLRGAKLIFILDEASRKDYLPYNRSLVKVTNSVVLPESYESFDAAARAARYAGRLLFAGRLSKDKGVENIMRAAASLSAAGTQVSLQVVGDGEQGEALRRLAKELDPQGSVITMTGAVPPAEVAEYMDLADILVMNSAFEGVPMTILEALSHGLPVISTDVGGIGEAVRFREPEGAGTDRQPQSAGTEEPPEGHGTGQNAHFDAERTDGSVQSIAAAVLRIRKNYAVYAGNAHANARQYDYREVNRLIYQNLAKFWKE